MSGVREPIVLGDLTGAAWVEVARRLAGYGLPVVGPGGPPVERGRGLRIDRFDESRTDSGGPVVYVLDRVTPEAVSRAFERGAVAVFGEPVDVETVVTAIRSIAFRG